jgi:hypothetical protein
MEQNLIKTRRTICLVANQTNPRYILQDQQTNMEKLGLIILQNKQIDTLNIKPWTLNLKP